MNENDTDFAIIKGLDVVAQFAIGKDWSEERFTEEARQCYLDQEFSSLFDSDDISGD